MSPFFDSLAFILSPIFPLFVLLLCLLLGQALSAVFVLLLYLCICVSVVFVYLYLLPGEGCLLSSAL